jgi:hypothetical protein
VTNKFWLMDREAGLAITFGTQVIPPGDAMVTETIMKVEKGIYGMTGLGSPFVQASTW